jgi:hypothetical protein
VGKDGKMEAVSLAKVFDAISNESSLGVFRTIAVTKGDSDVLRTKLNLTRKQYYSRISTLLKADLIKRVNGKYSLTLFGEILFDSILTIEKAFNNSYWKLKAIDSFEMGTPGLSAEERNKIIDTLLKDEEKIKDIVLAKLPT